MALYLACDLADYDTATGVCSAPYYTTLHPHSSSVLPPLTIEEGSAIAGAILLLWGFAFAIKAVKQALQSLN